MSVETTLSLLRSRMTRLEPGHVWLAGAGPGDPGCLTLDVVSALSQADVVVYDALVDPAVVAIAEQAPSCSSWESVAASFRSLKTRSPRG